MARYLAKPLAFPKVRRFSDLFEVAKPWFTTTEQEKTRLAVPLHGTMKIGPLLSFRDHPGDSMAVRATPMLVDWITHNMIEVEHDHLHFQIIGWGSREALVVVSYGRIIGDRWLAVIDPKTIPNLTGGGRRARSASGSADASHHLGRDIRHGLERAKEGVENFFDRNRREHKRLEHRIDELTAKLDHARLHRHRYADASRTMEDLRLALDVAKRDLARIQGTSERRMLSEEEDAELRLRQERLERRLKSMIDRPREAVARTFLIFRGDKFLKSVQAKSEDDAIAQFVSTRSYKGSRRGGDLRAVASR